MRLKIISFVIASLFLSHCSYGQYILTQPEQEIWSKFLNSYLSTKHTVTGNYIQQLIIVKDYPKEDSTQAYSILTGYFRESEIQRNKIGQDSLWLNLVSKYDSLNARSFIINDPPKLNYQVVLVPNHLRDSIFKVKRGWKRFYKKYPNSYGILELSRVAISDDHTMAILSLHINKQSLNGGGYVYLLIKEGDTWIIFHQMELWVS